MRLRLILLVLLVLFSACAGSNQGLENIENTKPVAGSSSSSFGFGNFNCLLKLSWDTLSTLVAIGYIGYILHITAKESGGKASFLSGSANVLIFGYYVYSGGYCKFGYIMGVILIISSIIHKNLIDSSGTFAKLVPALDMILIVYLLQNPSIAANPYSFFAFAVAPVVLWIASRWVAAWSLGKLSGEDKGLLKAGFGGLWTKITGRFRKPPKDTTEKPPKEDAKAAMNEGGVDEAKAVSALEKSEVTLEKTEGEQEENELRAAADSGEIAVSEEIAGKISANKAKMRRGEVRGIKNAMTGLCAEASNLVKNIHAAKSVNEADAHLKQWLGEVYGRMINRLKHLDAQELQASSYYERMDKKALHFEVIRRWLFGKLESQEKKIRSTENKIKSTEKMGLKALSKAIWAKRSAMLKLDAKIKALQAGKVAGAAAKALTKGRVGGRIDEQQLAFLKQQKAQEQQLLAKLQNAEKILKRNADVLNKWERKARSVIKALLRDTKKVRKLSKTEEKITKEMANADAQVKSQVKAEEGVIIKMEQDLSASKNTQASDLPEYVAVGMVSNFRDYFAVSRSILGNFLYVEDKLFRNSLTALAENVSTTAMIIRRNMFLGQVQEIHAKGWRYINDTAEAIMGGKQLSAAHGKWENNIMANFNRIGQNLEEDRKINDITLARLKTSLDETTAQLNAVDSAVAEIQSAIQDSDKESSVFINDIQTVLTEVFKLKAANFEQYAQRAETVEKAIGQEEKGLKKTWKVAKKRVAGSKVFTKGLSWTERFTAGLRTKEKSVNKAAA